MTRHRSPQIQPASPTANGRRDRPVRRRLGVLLAVSSLACAGASQMTASAAASQRADCGRYVGKAGPYEVVVLWGRVPCRTARRVLRRYAVSHAPCAGSGCYRTLGGWTCGSGGTAAFPRLFSCTRHRRTVAAFSRAD